MAQPLENRTALVTGASRGIGKACAIALADAGADVAVNYVARKADAEQVAEAIRKRGRKVAVLQADVSDSQAVAALVRDAERALGPIDILVNNAGIAVRRGLDDLSEEDFDRTILVNLK